MSVISALSKSLTLRVASMRLWQDAVAEYLRSDAIQDLGVRLYTFDRKILDVYSGTFQP